MNTVSHCLLKKDWSEPLCLSLLVFSLSLLPYSFYSFLILKHSLKTPPVISSHSTREFFLSLLHSKFKTLHNITTPLPI